MAFKKILGRLNNTPTLILQGNSTKTRELKSLEFFNTNTSAEVIAVHYVPNPNLALIDATGAIDAFKVVGGGYGNYSVNGGAPFTLPVTEAALDAIVKATNAGAVVKGLSAGSTSLGKKQQVQYTGTGPLEIGSGAGKITVDLTTPETPSAFLTRFNNANPARQVALGVGATIAKAVPGTAGDVTVAGAGESGVNQNYPATVNYNGAKQYYDGPSNGHYVFWNGTQWEIGNKGGLTFYTAPGTAAAGPPMNGWVPAASPAPAPTVTSNNVTGGTAGSANLPLFDAGAAGALADFAVSAGATSTITAPEATNASADFAIYYPKTNLPILTSATGIGASIARLASGVLPDLAPGVADVTNQMNQKSVATVTNFPIPVSASGAPLPVLNGESVFAKTTTAAKVNFTAIYWEE